jgi:hypothetical protein
MWRRRRGLLVREGWERMGSKWYRAIIVLSWNLLWGIKEDHHVPFRI